MRGESLTAIIGRDVPVPQVAPYTPPRPKPKGLDWAKISPPPAEAPAVMPTTTKSAYAQDTAAHEEALQRVQHLEARPADQAPPTPRPKRRTTPRPRVKSTGTILHASQTPIEVANPDILTTIRDAYTIEHVSIEIIAARIGISPQTVSRVMRRNGITARGQDTAGQHAASRLRARLDELGTTPAQIREWARENGVRVTDRGVLAATIVDEWEQAHA